MKRRLAAIFPLALAVVGCAAGGGDDPAVRAAADEAEAAIGQTIVFARKYQDGAAYLGEARPGRGSLAGKPAECGRDDKGGRAIRTDWSVTREGAIGSDPAVFAELWRRAGC